MENKNLKLVNIGCGHTYHPDWINLDLRSTKYVKKYNIKNALPFADNSVDVVYHSHVLEHLARNEAHNFIFECYRALKPNGIMRLAVPDLEQICREYLANLEKGFDNDNKLAVKDYHWNKLELFDQLIRNKSGGEMFEVIQSHRDMINEDYVVKRNGDDFKKFFTDNNPIMAKPFIKKQIIRILNLISRIFFFRSGERHKWMYDKLDLKILLDGIDFKNF